MKRVIFIKNTLLLSGTTLILRFAGMIFKIWLSGKAGSEAIGLYQIIMSVYICISSFASSGICTAVTRLVTDDLALKGNGIRKIVSNGIFLTLILAFFGFSIMFFGAEFISVAIINDARAIAPLKILAVALIFIGICSVFRGYFLARRKALGSSVSQITEQLVRIVITGAVLLKTDEITVISATIAIVIGDVAAEITASLLLFVMYLADVGRKKEVGGKVSTRALLRIALPITAGRYLSTILRTAESAAVPRLLTTSGMTNEAALSSFGIIKGMALPLILFPSALLSTISLLLIPEISEAKAQKRKNLLKSTVFSSLKITTLISVFIGFIFWFFGEELGVLLYKDTAAGVIIKYLAPLTPLMYIDNIADGLLKGLDKQNEAFRYSVLDSASRLALIFFIIPKFSLAGFIFIMYLSNILTAFLHFRLLIKTVGLKINFSSFFVFPFLLCLAICFILRTILNQIPIIVTLKVGIFCFTALCFYILLLKVFGLLRKNEFI